MFDPVPVIALEPGPVLPMILPWAMVHAMVEVTLVYQRIPRPIQRALAMQLSFEEVAQVFMAILLVLKLAIAPELVALLLERPFVPEMLGLHPAVLLLVIAVLPLESEVGRGLFALPVHFSILELTYIIVLR